MKALEAFTASHGKYLERRSGTVELFLADNKIPAKSPVRATLEDWINEYPLVDFVEDELSRELYDLDQYLKDRETLPLKEVEGYADLGLVADRLLKKLQSLPWSYVVTFPLPAPISDGFQPNFDHLELSPTMSLRRGGAAIERLTPLKDAPAAAAKRLRGTGILAAILGNAADWSADLIYLQIKVEGFIGPYGESGPHHQAISKLKSFFGLLIALRGLTVGPRSLEPTSRIETIIHRKENEKFVADNKIQAPSPISDTLARLNVFDDEGKLKDDPRRRIWFHQNLSRVAEVLSSPSYTDNLLLAAQWVFDSQTDADPLVRYIRSMVVLEILLGSQKDAPELSIGDLISNRCAYLIAGDFKQRAEITSDFKKIYGIRSQIVHRGKTKLTLEERALLNNLEWMGRRVIQEEIKKIPRPVEDA